MNADLQPKGDAQRLTVRAAEFSANQPIPKQCSAEGGNAAPTISWSGVPAGAKSVALIVDDSDAQGFTHWVVFDIPPDATKLPAPSEKEGKNDSGSNGYFGPKPPPGSPHHYHFHLYALDTKVSLEDGASKNEVLQSMSGHVIADGELVGIFQSG